eukprot:3941286-Amphidinium_carterae.1
MGTLVFTKLRVQSCERFSMGLLVIAVYFDKCHFAVLLAICLEAGQRIPVVLDVACNVFQCMYEEHPQWDAVHDGELPSHPHCLILQAKEEELKRKTWVCKVASIGFLGCPAALARSCFDPTDSCQVGK